MALVTVQRAPSPRRDGRGDDESDGEHKSSGGSHKPRTRSQSGFKKLVNTVNTIRFVNRLRFSESYFTIKGAALILPKSEKLPALKKKSKYKPKPSVDVTDIQHDLQSMFHELRPDDTIQVAIRLESSTSYARYLAIAATAGQDDKEESVIFGFNCVDSIAHLGLVLPIYRNTELTLDGDGGFRVCTNDRPHIFKPISIQAMWSALMSLNKACETARLYNYAIGGQTHQWVQHYINMITSNQVLINEWDYLDDLMVTRPDQVVQRDTGSIESTIRALLRELMVGINLEDVTSYMLRLQLEEKLNRSLKQYKSFIDQEMMLVIRQLDVATEIFDFLYLGSEWNASNLTELKENGIGFILNVTREIDNFFPGVFKYMNIRLFDDETADLMKHWEHTHRFICKARDNNSKVLVHCKMGVSRSASTVIAFAMKEWHWSLDNALEFVHRKRDVIKPNDSFMHQLRTYEGILNASNQRNKFRADIQRQASAPGRVDQLAQEQKTSNKDDNACAVSKLASSDDESNAQIRRPTSAYSRLEDTDQAYNNLLEEDDHSDSVTLCSTCSRESSPISVTSYDFRQSYADDESNGSKTSLLINEDDSRLPAIPHASTCSCPNEAQQRISPSKQVKRNNKQQTCLPSDDTASVESENSNQTDFDDVSVCSGIVKKTKEQIQSRPQSVILNTPSKTDDVDQVAPGTVQKVLGEINERYKSGDLNELPPRSASFKLLRKKLNTSNDFIQRSASVRISKAKQRSGLFKASSLDTAEPKPINDKDDEYRRTFKRINQRNSDINFLVGSDDSDEGDDDKLSTLPYSSTVTIVPDSSVQQLTIITCQCTPNSTMKCESSECLLKVASKPVLSRDSNNSQMETSSSCSVKSLVGAFEDIGSVSTPTRPLTIHVDSFSSDPFANDNISTVKSISRAQSMKSFDSDSKSSKQKKTFNIRDLSSSAQRILPPYWKLKQESLTRTFSGSQLTSKDMT